MLQEVCHSVNFVVIISLTQGSMVIYVYYFKNFYLTFLMNYFYLIPYGQILDIREFMAAINFLCSKSWMRI